MICSVCEDGGWVCENHRIYLGRASTLPNAAAPVSLALDAIRAIGMRRRDYLAALSSMKMNKAGAGRRRQSPDLAFSSR